MTHMFQLRLLGLLFLFSITNGPSYALWLNWHPPKERPDMAFSLEADRYLAAYGEWKHAADDHKYENWATERMSAMQDHAVGIQLADENLGKRPARFMKDENLTRLDSLRAKYDTSGLFRPWMGRGLICRAFPAGP